MLNNPKIVSFIAKKIYRINKSSLLSSVIADICQIVALSQIAGRCTEQLLYQPPVRPQ